LETDLSEHSTLYADTGLAALFALHADTGRVVYVVPPSVETDVEAIVGNESIFEGESQGERTSETRREVTISTDVVASPAMNCTVKVDGVEYAIRDILSAGQGFTTLLLSRVPSSETARPGYRGTYGRMTSRR
jgi:hypothetical protein